MYVNLNCSGSRIVVYWVKNRRYCLLTPPICNSIQSWNILDFILHTTTLAHLSVKCSIWATGYTGPLGRVVKWLEVCKFSRIGKLKNPDGIAWTWIRTGDVTQLTTQQKLWQHSPHWLHTQRLGEFIAAYQIWLGADWIILSAPYPDWENSLKCII
mgnify:CR=1 FL=1